MEGEQASEFEERDISALPEGCVANVLSFTSPRDACCCAVVSSMFKNASLSDTVWERFLPDDYHSIISESGDPFLVSSSCSKKQLFFRLCEKPVIVDEGKKSVALDKRSGKKCYMLSARDLNIVWGSTPTYWKWNSDPQSRFPEVAELLNVCWLEISGKINTNMLSPSTLYSSYLVFKLSESAHGLHDPPAEATVAVGGKTESTKRTVYLDGDISFRGNRRGPVFARTPLRLRSRGGMLRWAPIVEEEPSETSGGSSREPPKERGDGWLEVELGEFLSGSGSVDGEDLEVSVMEVQSGNWKSGLVIEGIEIRPKRA